MTDGDGNRLGLGAKDQLRAARVEQVQLFRAAAHVGIVLLNKVPTDLILGDAVLLVRDGRIARSGGGRRLEIRRTVHGGRDVAVGVRIGVLRREGAVDGDLSSVGHGERNWRQMSLEDRRNVGWSRVKLNVKREKKKGI